MVLKLNGAQAICSASKMERNQYEAQAKYGASKMERMQNGAYAKWSVINMKRKQNEEHANWITFRKVERVYQIMSRLQNGVKRIQDRE